MPGMCARAVKHLVKAQLHVAMCAMEGQAFNCFRPSALFLEPESRG